MAVKNIIFVGNLNMTQSILWRRSDCSLSINRGEIFGLDLSFDKILLKYETILMNR